MTLVAITMTAPEAASPVQMYRATYSPDDNKLRLYAVSRLDPETYKKVHDAGFRWAPKQALFVAPAWTPGREDVLLSLAGEIEDEDSTLAERQEARAERFTGYSGKRASESAQALDEVERLAAMIPPGQPILVGHHSERRARRDAQRIENGMKRAVMLFERAEYWEERARSALLHAKYKERPDVRWRRIKKIEADLRKAEKTIAQSRKYLTMWRAESLDLNMAKLISSHDHISACFPLDTYPRPAEKSQYEGRRSLWSALDDDIITTEQAREIAIRCHERQIQHQQRWVNSLVTALKLPDESAKANEVLGEMSFPQFSRLLPYRDYNQESGLFMNDTTMGFMLEAIPINGANESIVEALDHMLRTKLPRGVPFCIHLMSSQLVGDRIEYGLREFSWSGEQAERFNAITRAYYMNAAATQFPLPEGMNLPLTLRHYRVFFSYCSPSKKKSRADILEMENLVKIIRASLQGASITTQAVDAQAFIDIVGEMINHNPDSLYPKRRQLDPYSDLNYQCVEDSFDLKVRADYLTLGLREKGRNSTARILNFHLARNPEIAFLWNMADNYSNLLNPELSISCPFILTLTLVVEDQVKTHSEANLKYMDLEKKSKTSYAKWFPSVEKEAKEWGGTASAAGLRSVLCRVLLPQHHSLLQGQ